VGPYMPYGLFETTGEMCAKFGSDRFRNVDLYKVQTNIQTFIFIYKIVELATCFDPAGSSSDLYVNQVMLKKTAYIFGIPLMFTKDIYIYISLGYH